MAGSVAGGKLAAITNKQRHGDDFYQKNGHLSQISYMSKPREERKPRGFAVNPELASEAGRKGGSTSRRTSKQ